MRIVSAIVLSNGAKTELKPGDKIAFTRLYFGWLKKLNDGCFFGWIDDNQVLGYDETDSE